MEKVIGGKMTINECNNEISAKIKIIDSDIQNGHLSHKNVANFAISFYQHVEKYDESTLIDILKNSVKFYNTELEIFPEKNEIIRYKKLEREILEFCESSKSEYKFLKITREDFDSIRDFFQEYKILKENFEELAQKPPKFFKKNWKNSLNQVLMNIEFLKDSLEFERKKRGQIINIKEIENEEVFEKINSSLKELVKETNPEIGIQLAELQYFTVTEERENLESYMGKYIFEQLKSYFSKKITIKST